MAYVKQDPTTGDTITQSLLRTMETQYDEAATDLTAHTDATSVHSAASAATPSRIVLRDASGRARFAAPSDVTDAARKQEVDDAEDLAFVLALIL